MFIQLISQDKENNNNFEGNEANLFIMIGESIFLVSHGRIVGVISLLLYAEPVYGPSHQGHCHQHSHYYQDYHEYA